MNINQVYDDHVRSLPLVDRLRLAERIVAQAALEAAAVKPLPPLGGQLRAIRARIEQAGEPLLDESALKAELAQRRGGAEAAEHADHAHVR